MNDKHVPACEGFYRELHKTCESVMTASFQCESAHLHSNSHSFVGDLEKWINIMENRPEVSMMKAALREYQFALLALVEGLYRQAFMALRLFLELALGAVLLSTNELNLRLWLRGDQDLSWKSVVDPDSGVFSAQFLKAFCETLVEDGPQYCTIAKRVYRECSEHVHGSFQTHDSLPSKVSFHEAAFSDWHTKSLSARLAVTFALSARYMMFLDGAKLLTAEPLILDQLAHIPSIRNVFERTMETK